MYEAFAASQGAGGASGGSAPGSTAEPKLPLWLKDYPYPKLKGDLQELVYRYEQGELTATEVASSFEYHHQGSSIHVQVELAPDPANTDVVVAWLKSSGVSPLHTGKHEAYPNIISGLVPVPLLATLSQQPGVYRIKIAEYWDADSPQVALCPSTPIHNLRRRVRHNLIHHLRLRRLLRR